MTGYFDVYNPLLHHTYLFPKLGVVVTVLMYLWGKSGKRISPATLTKCFEIARRTAAEVGGGFILEVLWVFRISELFLENFWASNVEASL